MRKKGFFVGSRTTEKDEDAINSFKSTRAYSQIKRPVEEVVMEKLRRGNRQASGLTEQELRDWAKSLSIPEDLKACYLNPEFARQVAKFEELDKLHKKTIAGNSSPKTSVIPTSNAVSTSGPVERMEELHDIDFDMDEIFKEQDAPQYQIEKKAIKVKLVITEILASDLQKTFRKMMSPILTSFDYHGQFGMFHSAVIIGPWYIEWNNSSLAIPRKCYSGAALIAADLNMGKEAHKSIPVGEAIDRITPVILKWNLTKTYAQTKDNCQAFVDDICAALDIDLTKIEGMLGDYLKRLRTNGQCELDFRLRPDFREKFKIKETLLKFNTHRELDQFVAKLTEQDYRFEHTHPQEWALLKSFDRAFWLRHYKNKDDENYMPLYPENARNLDVCECPFGDPQQSMSLKKDWF